MVAFDLQTSRSSRTLHLRTQPTRSLDLLQLSRGRNDGASSPRDHAATAASRSANTDRPEWREDRASRRGTVCCKQELTFILTSHSITTVADRRAGDL